MSDEVKEVLDGVLESEGGEYTNDPLDRGGPTKWGVTLETLELDRRRACVAADVARLTREDAYAIFLRRYVLKPRFNQMFSGVLLYLVVDSAVNHGVDRVELWIQEAVGVKMDGVIGPITEQAIRNAEPGSLFLKLAARRIDFYGDILRARPSQVKWANGWLDRVARILRRAAA